MIYDQGLQYIIPCHYVHKIETTNFWGIWGWDMNGGGVLHTMNDTIIMPWHIRRWKITCHGQSLGMAHADI